MSYFESCCQSFAQDAMMRVIGLLACLVLAAAEAEASAGAVDQHRGQDSAPRIHVTSDKTRHDLTVKSQTPRNRVQLHDTKKSNNKLPSMALVSGCVPKMSHSNQAHDDENCANSRRDKREFCDCQHWSCHVHGQNDMSRFVSNSEGYDVKWNKVFWMKEALEKSDWALWVDGDAYMMDHNSDSLQQLAAKAPANKHLIYGEDKNGPNLGVFLLRSGKWAQNMLDKMWGLRHIIQPRDEKTGKLKISKHIDQIALKNIRKSDPNFDDGIWSVPMGKLQGYPFNPEGVKWEEGIPISHIVGCPDHCQGKTQTVMKDVKHCRHDPKANLLQSQGGGVVVSMLDHVRRHGGGR